MNVKVVTTDGQLQDPQAPDASMEVYKFLDFLVGPGWVIHRLDEELGVAGLLRVDAPKTRNLHAEVLIAAMGVAAGARPRLYGDAVFLSWDVSMVTRRPKLAALSVFHDELITETFATMEQVGA